MKKRAFGVAETLIASTIIALVIMGLFAISSTSARAAQTQSARVTAAALAEEGLDIVRYERERYWRGLAGVPNAGRSAEGFWTHLSSIGAPQITDELYWTEMSPGWSDLSVVAGYSRSLKISRDTGNMTGALAYQSATTGNPSLLTTAEATDAGASLLKISVTVNWIGPGGADSYVLSTYLTDWLEGML